MPGLSWAVVCLEVTSAQHRCSMDPVISFNLGYHICPESNQLEESKVKNKKMRFVLCGYIRRRDKEIQEKPQVCLWVPKMRIKSKQGLENVDISAARVQGPAYLTDPAFSGLQCICQVG